MSFAAGLVSFFSPCVLPLYPSYLSYLSGVSLHSVDERLLTWDARMRVVAHALFFMLGFSAIFFALGLSASSLGRVFIQYRGVIRVAGGLLVTGMGLVLAGILKPAWLMREWKLFGRARKFGYISSFFVGLTFAAGWTPCIGPILSSVLVLAATHAALGIPLMVAYVAGFSIPFLAIAGGFASLGRLRSLARYSAWISRVSGYLLVFLGVLLVAHGLAPTGWAARVMGQWG
ncbi:cytochrome c biogenesis protein CcdA [Alicyclobacillus mali (ex Roth et al. 2021)]|uniref:cytochrome c biogenesis protein CcdA n=1 Tax=Alicyclobacillus mali (ex Roth et al. 2021) TaxID=1123961 RepID=UPI001A8DCE02